MIYKIVCVIMLLSLLYLGFSNPDIKSRLLAILFAVANGIIFWR